MKFASPRIGVNISAGTQMANSATVEFSDSGGISFGVSLSASSLVITASALGGSAGIQSMSAGSTRITSGEAVFSNSNGISFGASGQAVTASLPKISYWNNHRWDASGNAVLGDSNFQMVLDRISFQFGIDVTQADVLLSGNAGANSWFSLPFSTLSITPGEYVVGFQLSRGGAGLTNCSVSIGIYTINRSTINLLSSASTLAVSFGAFFGQRLGDGGFQMPGGVQSIGYFGAGFYSSTSPATAMPPSIQLSEVVARWDNANLPGIPYLQLAGTF